MELTISQISEGKVLRFGEVMAKIDGKRMPTKISGKMIQAACLQIPDGICFINRAMFPIQCPMGEIQGGDGVTFHQLEQLGVRTFACRYNHDRDLTTIKVK